MPITITKKYLDGLQLIHFITDPENYKILRYLLEQSNSVSIREVSEATNIPKGITKRRLQKFVFKHLCDVTLDLPKYETQRPTKSYKSMYMIKINNRAILNSMVDIFEKAGCNLE